VNNALDSEKPNENSMKKNVGVWIDHRKAVIIRISGDVDEIHAIESDMEKHVRYAGGKPEDQQEHRFANHLNEYYAKVIAALDDADSIFILGPGEAKGEFEKRLRAGSFGERIDGIETLDKMPYDQIAAKVRAHFLNPAEESHHKRQH
jgi:stalled ribosome rescue protein Dom34